MSGKRDISLINLIVSFGFDETEKSEGENKHAETESDNEGRVRRSLFHPYPRLRHECENQGGRHISYSRNTFAIPESYRHTPSFVFSFFFLLIRI